MTAQPLRARDVLAEIDGLGATHLVGLPDNASAALFELAAGHDRIQVLNVTREGEAFALAAGLWIGGKTPVVLVQNTGLFESGDSFRGTVLRMRIPLLCLITCRGYARMAVTGLSMPKPPFDGDLLGRADIDSAALFTEPTLNAWGLPWYSLEKELDHPNISLAWRQAQDQSRPVALLVVTALV